MTGSRDLVSLLDLGEMALTGIFPKPGVEVPSGPVELVLCPDGGLVQLRQSYDPSLMYGENYGYRSGLNGSMVRHLAGIAVSLERRCPTRAGDVVLDIGSNDGTLLSAYQNWGQRFVGMDPTSLKFLRFYLPHVQAVPEFFSESGYRVFVGDRRASIVTSIAMLYDLEQPLAFMQAVSRILADDGIWYTEQSYLPALLESCAYDTICHEHLEYYGLTQLQWMADRADLRIIEAKPNDTNGGSLAVTFAHRQSRHRADSANLALLLGAERQRGLDEPDGFVAFQSAVARHRVELPALIRSLRAAGKTVFGYGASTKGNVLLQACGLTSDDLPCIADVNPDKHGCVTPGTHIPIVSEADAHAQQPDYFLVMPWHFRPFILEREAAFLQRGGKLIFPLPTIDVVGA
jgi:SAM-dependent methyltransferase